MLFLISAVIVYFIKMELLPKSSSLIYINIAGFIIVFYLYFFTKVSFFLHMLNIVFGKFTIYVLYFSLFLHILFLYISIFTAFYSVFI